MTQFKCTNKYCTQNEIPLNAPIYIMRAKNGVTTYHYKNNGRQIVCPTCEEPLSIIEEFDGFATARSMFNSRTPQQKKEILKRRANQHFKKNTDGMRDYRDFMDEK